MSDQENDYKWTDDILELDEKHKIKGEIYKIKNIVNNKCYVGQVVSHRKNKNKYRPFGYNRRLQDHISEAINNTKKNQCQYLNNAIRKNGKEKFDVELIEICDTDKMDEREQFYIKKFNTIYPNGYNLTMGGKTTEHVKIENDENLKPVKKRGRDFGYVHKDSTKKKMSSRLKEIASTDIVRNRMKTTMNKHYDEKKLEILKEYELDDDIESYIKPVKSKETGEIHDYIIKIEGRKLTVRTENQTPDEKYNRLKDILTKVKNEQ